MLKINQPPVAPSLDRLAAANPAEFIRSAAAYQWPQIVAWYRQGLLSTETGGGMTALLDHRKQTVEKFLNIIRQESGPQAQAFLNQAALGHARNAGLTDSAAVDYAGRFAQARQEIDWEVPGSKDPTSDLDVSLHGDGTEWAVGRFNALFSADHDGHESGVVFDTNLYAADFIPTNDDQEFIKTGPEDTQTVSIVFDYTFSRAEAQHDDDEAQQSAALLHLRRYVAAPDWISLAQSLDATDPQLSPALLAVDQQFNYNCTAVAKHILAAASPPLLAHLAASVGQVANTLGLVADCPPSAEVVWPPALAEAVSHHPEVSRNDLMAAENRLYEARLGEVARLRVAFALVDFDRRALSAELPSAQLAAAAACDQAYLALRTAISASCYFANECYASAGAKIQVVGGKQKWSKGTNFGRLDKAHLRNINYTPEMLIDSILEQTGDLYKEIRHHPRPDLGGAALAAAKYLHRWFNAQKHLYRIIGPALGRDYPAAFVSAEAFTQVRKACGMGLEELKRLPSAPNNSPEMEAHRRALAQQLFGSQARWAELTASPAIAAEVIQAQFHPANLAQTEVPADCEALLTVVRLMAAAALLDYHVWQRQPAGR